MRAVSMWAVSSRERSAVHLALYSTAAKVSPSTDYHYHSIVHEVTKGTRLSLIQSSPFVAVSSSFSHSSSSCSGYTHTDRPRAQSAQASLGTVKLRAQE
jgi:hypothetical protein